MRPGRKEFSLSERLVRLKLSAARVPSGGEGPSAAGRNEAKTSKNKQRGDRREEKRPGVLTMLSFWVLYVSFRSLLYPNILPRFMNIKFPVMLSEFELGFHHF